jgi:Fe-S-cluster-containing dehydrogenase component
MSEMESPQQEQKRVSRRGLLKWLLLPVGFLLSFGTGFGAYLQFGKWLRSGPPPAPKYGILVDPSICIQCLKCLDACEERHGHENPGLYYTDVRIVRDGMEPALPLPLLCRHCADPPCQKACVANAITKLSWGPVVHERDKCIGCLYCIANCPFDSFHYDAKQNVPFKCDMCHERLAEGLEPACVQICPTKARTFGKYDDMVAKGKQRAQEIGGSLLYPGETSTLYVINDEKLARLEEMGLFKSQYPTENRTIGDVARYMRLTLIPVAIGSVYYFLEWRKNRMEELVRVQKRGRD